VRYEKNQTKEKGRKKKREKEKERSLGGFVRNERRKGKKRERMISEFGS